MHFAIVGAGVAGSYLGNMLDRSAHRVEVFEGSTQQSHWPVCAWGASRHMLAKFSANADLEFADYILHVGKRLRMDLPQGKQEYLDLKGLVTYDKHRWEQQLLKGLKVNYGMRVDKSSFPYGDYDYVIDCTGLHRTLLP